MYIYIYIYIYVYRNIYVSLFLSLCKSINSDNLRKSLTIILDFTNSLDIDKMLGNIMILVETWCSSANSDAYRCLGSQVQSWIGPAVKPPDSGVRSRQSQVRFPARATNLGASVGKDHFGTLPAHVRHQSGPTLERNYPSFSTIVKQRNKPFPGIALHVSPQQLINKHEKWTSQRS